MYCYSGSLAAALHRPGILRYSQPIPPDRQPIRHLLEASATAKPCPRHGTGISLA